MSNLAIVIPAYKIEYFDKALESLSLQSNIDFTVYVGDDNSPYDLISIVNKYVSKIDLVYKRFDNNIGSKNIISQWERCINLSKNEKWIWLFSDDDLVDLNAVKNFYSIVAVNQFRFDVYRFNTYVIDQYDYVIAKSPIGPMEESSEQMAYNLLLGLRGNCMPDHIFLRTVYKKYGGFVRTEYAQAADWATSILFSNEKGICIIPESILYWRMSGINISSIAKDKSKKMLLGHLQFITWIMEHFNYLNSKNYSGKISYDAMRNAAKENLKRIILTHYQKLDNTNIINLLRVLLFNLHMSYKDSVRFIYEIKRETPSRINIIVKFLKKAKSYL